ncbi:MAG: flagellar basal body L-ring protein FlgH [Gammaproteobacteria bacterium]|nr:flagellar basal body L-ring protein FlgH [Gammaproteobacteria bacterium]
MMKHANIIALMSAAILSACAADLPKPDANFAAIRPILAEPMVVSNGSIYQPGSPSGIFSDSTARRIGDILTVILQESTAAKKSASNGGSKESSVDLPVPTLFGGGLTYNGRNLLETSVASKQKFAGKGDTAQSNSLTGRITVTVVETLANGNLVVQGEKLLTLNQGSEHIRFSGIVRIADIKADNTVLSSNVANAQIIYAGTGTLADSSTPGWLTRFFNSAWWPF